MRHTDGLNMKPSLEDYKKLVAAYQALTTVYEQQQVQIQQQNEQLAIKSSAIQQQTEDIKRLDSEVLWTRAALDQAQQVIEEATNGVAASDEAGWQEKYVRLKAETENLRKRWEQRSKDQAHEERNRILTDMLPLADHLEMALRHATDGPEAADKDAKKPDTSKSTGEPPNDDALVENIQATYTAFLSTLKRYNVEPIQALGEAFNPTVHEAIGRIPSEGVPADHVAQVVQTGYIDGEKLLRPARVLVSQ